MGSNQYNITVLSWFKSRTGFNFFSGLIVTTDQVKYICIHLAPLCSNMVSSHEIAVNRAG